MQIDFENKVVVVTGGGSGIGRAISIGFAENKANVVPVSRTENNVEEVIKKIEERGVDSLFYPTDLTAKKNVKDLADKVVDKFGHIDILVNCIGIVIKKPLLALDEENWDKTLSTNLRSVFLCCKYLGKYILGKYKERNDFGKVITIASVGSYQGIPTSSAYCASKGGILQLTKTLALEWAQNNVNVNAIVPGWIRTQMTRPVRSDKVTRERILARIPLGRIGEPEDVVGTALFLASQHSNYITGEAIWVDGGYLSSGA